MALKMFTSADHATIYYYSPDLPCLKNLNSLKSEGNEIGKNVQIVLSQLLGYQF